MCCTEKGPKISVIMGVHNIASLYVFQDAVDSILNQTMNDFEFIICDDGSTDNTWKILKQFSQRDRRIRLLRNEQNQGLAFTLNRCLKESKGKMIARQDADDLSAPERFELQVSFLEQHPKIGFVGSDVNLWDEYGAWGERCFPAFPKPKDFLFTMPFVHGALMFRKIALDKVQGYRVAKETRRAEDYDMLMRMYAVGIYGANLPQKLYAFLEDQNARKRRKYCYRIDEAVVRWKGFCALQLMPKAWPYVVKPLLVGLIPNFLLIQLKFWTKTQYKVRVRQGEKENKQ